MRETQAIIDEQLRDVAKQLEHPVKVAKKSVNSRRSRRRAPFYANGELRDPTSICENPGQRLLSARKSSPVPILVRRPNP